MKRRGIIRLDPLPESWGDISSEKLEQICKLGVKKRSIAHAVGEAKADSIYHLDCFLLLANLKVKKKYAIDDYGNIMFIFRRRGIKYFFENIPMGADVVRWWMRKLSFLDKETSMFMSPYDIVKLRGKRFKCPCAVMADITYHQYMRAQNLLIGYWSVVEKIEKEDNGEILRTLLKEAERIQSRFLATLFNMETIIITENGGDVRLKKPRVDFKYIEAQGDLNARFFHKSVKRMFPVMAQFFQSCQNYYCELFPDLFTQNSSGGKNVNMLKVELETVNSLMKYQGFKDYDNIYGAQAVRILDVLNQMSKEAKKIKEMEARVHVNR